MIENNQSGKDSPSENISNDLLEKSRGAYRSFEDYVRFTDNDPIWMLAYKLTLRFIGIGIMILLSPFLLIGLTIAFLAVL